MSKGKRKNEIAQQKLNKKKKEKKQKSHKPKVQRTSPARYLKEVRLELKKVAWPSRPEVVASSVIVIIAVIIFGAYTGALDALFQYILKITSR